MQEWTGRRLLLVLLVLLLRMMIVGLLLTCLLLMRLLIGLIWQGGIDQAGNTRQFDLKWLLLLLLLLQLLLQEKSLALLDEQREHGRVDGAIESASCIGRLCSSFLALQLLLAECVDGGHQIERVGDGCC